MLKLTKEELLKVEIDRILRNSDDSKPDVFKLEELQSKLSDLTEKRIDKQNKMKKKNNL